MYLSHPSVVIDWNYVRSEHEPQIPSGYQCIICDQTLHEIAHTTSKDGVPHWEPFCWKFFTWARAVRDRLWVARLPGMLFAIEQQRNSRLAYAEIVSLEASERLRRSLKDRNVDWIAEMNAVRGAAADQERSAHKVDFVQFGESIFELASQLRAKKIWVPQTPEEKLAMASDPNFLAAQMRNFRKNIPEAWPDQILQNINRYAYARWLRINCWYALNYTPGKNSKYGNNYDDAVYALFGSYTGHLATHDAKLRCMMSHLFQGIRFL